MRSRLPFIAVMATIMIDAMGIGLILPVMPDLIEQIMGEDISHAALWGGVLSFTYAAMQFLFGPTIGNLSDRFGRRPVLITSLVILGIDYLIMSVAQSIWLLVLARAMSGDLPPETSLVLM
ncbi:MFS transporter [Halovulum sp. GXIMD14793]